jgi:hypothetical protein
MPRFSIFDFRIRNRNMVVQLWRRFKGLDLINLVISVAIPSTVPELDQVNEVYPQTLAVAIG